jgi:hypothetical protein
MCSTTLLARQLESFISPIVPSLFIGNFQFDGDPGCPNNRSLKMSSMELINASVSP